MKWLLIALFPLATFAETLHRGENCGPNKNLLSDFSEVVRFIDKQNKLMKGNETECSVAEGFYDLNDGGQKRKVRISTVHPGHMVFLGANRYHSVLRVDDVDDNKKERFSGLLVNTDRGWFLTRLKPGVTHPYPSTHQETATIPAFEDFFLRGRSDPPGVTVHELSFDRARAVGRSSSGSLTLEYDSRGTIKRFLDQSSSPLAFLRRLNEHSIRIPPQMYDLLKDPEFIKARESRQNSKMYDLLFKQAMKLADNDVAQALFIALLSVDLRDRGPCGAIEGIRGHGLVPRSIFDNEAPEASVIGARYDAAQHFFGYAMLAQKFGAKAAQSYSNISKSEWQKSFGRFFRNLHDGGEPDFDQDDSFRPPIVAYWYQGADLRYRPEYDKLADLHYNRLGIAFGERLMTSAESKPSEVIRDPKFKKFEFEMGLPHDRTNPWVQEPKEAEIGISSILKKPTTNEIIFLLEPPPSLNWAQVEPQKVQITTLGTVKEIQNCVQDFTLRPHNRMTLHLAESAECKGLYNDSNQKFLFRFKGRSYFFGTNP